MNELPGCDVIKNKLFNKKKEAKLNDAWGYKKLHSTYIILIVYFNYISGQILLINASFCYAILAELFFFYVGLK